MSDPRHIVALGGGGFSSTPDNPLIDDFILSLARRRGAGGVPRVCFLPTASGDAEGYIARFLPAFPAARAEASVLRLFMRNVADLEPFVLAQDVIYVGGGNTANMLAVWRVQGLDALLRRAWEQGTVLCGISAGMNCWFEGCSTDSFGPLAPLADGLGFVAGSACPHFDSEPGRAETMLSFVRAGRLPDGYGAEEETALHFVGTSLAECVSSTAGKRCHRITPVGIEPLPTRFLG